MRNPRRGTVVDIVVVALIATCAIFAALFLTTHKLL